jgi:hypothetical protein
MTKFLQSSKISAMLKFSLGVKSPSIKDNETGSIIEYGFSHYIDRI